MVRGVKLNLTEFMSFISFYIFTDHYLFQCLEVIFFGYLQAAGGQSWLLKTFYVLDIL